MASHPTCDESVAFTVDGDAIAFESPRLDILNMFAIYFDSGIGQSLI